MTATLTSTKFPSNLAEAVRDMRLLPADCFLTISEAAINADGRRVILFAVGRDLKTGCFYGLGVSQDYQTTHYNLYRRGPKGVWNKLGLKGSLWSEQWVAQNAKTCLMGVLRAVDALRAANFQTAAAL